MRANPFLKMGQQARKADGESSSTTAAESQPQSPTTTSSSSSQQQWHTLIQRLAQENSNLMKELSVITSERQTWATQLDDAQHALGSREESSSKLSSEATQLKEQIAKLRSDLKIVTDERDFFKTKVDAMNNGGGGGSDHDLASALQDLRDELDDRQHDLKQANAECATLRKQVAELKKNQQQQQHQDPQVGGVSNNGGDDSKKTKRRLEELEASNKEIAQQRDIFIEREEKLIARESRDVAEMQAWAQLIKMLLGNLKNVRAQWDSEVWAIGGQRDEDQAAKFITENVDSDQARYTLETLHRVIEKVKRGPPQQGGAGGGGGSTAAAGGGGADVSGGGGSGDNFTNHLRRDVVEALRLLHGVFLDAAVLWGYAQQLKRSQEAKQAAQAAAPATKSSLAFWK